MAPRRPILVTIAALMLVAGVSPASATTTRWHRGLGGPATTKSPESAARQFVRDHAARLGLERVDLGAEPRIIPWRGHKILRFAQLYEGLEVFERALIFRFPVGTFFQPVQHATVLSSPNPPG